MTKKNTKFPLKGNIKTLYHTILCVCMCTCLFACAAHVWWAWKSEEDISPLTLEFQAFLNDIGFTTKPVSSARILSSLLHSAISPSLQPLLRLVTNERMSDSMNEWINKWMNEQTNKILINHRTKFRIASGKHERIIILLDLCLKITNWWSR